MANDVLTLLTSEAVTIFRSLSTITTQQNPFANVFLASDAVMNEAQGLVNPLQLDTPGMQQLVDRIFSDPDFDILAPKDGELDPMILYPGGGMRGPVNGLIMGIFHSALLQIYYLRQPNNESTFVRNAIDGFEELRRAVRGERVRCYLITGIGRISLPEGCCVTTPWGQIKPISAKTQTPWLFPFMQPQTTCILAEPKLWPVIFDRSPEVHHTFDSADQAVSSSHNLFPLACALASQDSENPVVPLVTWTTALLPFMGSFSYSTPLLPRKFGADIDFGSQITELEEWARLVEKTHAPSIDVAVRRIVSAVAHRNDKSDSLIDAVMAWENLLGTSNEVTFRVSASLTKLIEKDAKNRTSLRKRISEIYGIRSRLVHGASVDAAELNLACTEAISIAIQALRASYHLGTNWLTLSSSDRSNKILLEWP
jgi:hypothetical protein